MTIERRHLYPDIEPYETGRLRVSDTHEIYWEVSGNPAGKPVVFVVPVGQAVLGLREKIIAGQAPGLKTQDDLFTDAIGHARPPLQALAAYCHFAVIYRRSPVGLPLPAALEKAKVPEAEKLNRLLQELAWEAVRQHPLSGVEAAGRP